MISISVDDKALRVRVKQLGALKIGDISRYKQAILSETQKEVSKNFASQNGGKWKRLKQSTIDQKKRLGFSSPTTPLVGKGDLKTAVDNLSIREFNLGRSLSIGITDTKIKRIAGFQQLGTKTIPSRPFLIVSTTFSKNLIQTIQTGEIKNLQEQLKNNI